jgi:hypothetical protein
MNKATNHYLKLIYLLSDSYKVDIVDTYDSVKRKTIVLKNKLNIEFNLLIASILYDKGNSLNLEFMSYVNKNIHFIPDTDPTYLKKVRKDKLEKIIQKI